MKCSKCHEEIPMYEDDMRYHANDYGNVCKECYDSIMTQLERKCIANNITPDYAVLVKGDVIIKYNKRDKEGVKYEN